MRKVTEQLNEKLTTEAILLQIVVHFQQVMQWSTLMIPEWSVRISANLFRAEALIELLEKLDCGHVGGFDERQRARNNNPKLFDRWEWLYRKHIGDPAGAVFENRITYALMKKFFVRRHLFKEDK